MERATPQAIALVAFPPKVAATLLEAVDSLAMEVTKAKSFSLRP